MRRERKVLLPSFKVLSSGGLTSEFGRGPCSSGTRHGGLELVNQTSGKASPLHLTCARLRLGEKKVVRRVIGMSGERNLDLRV